MTDRKPTREQIRKFREWCGFKIEKEAVYDGGKLKHLPIIILPNGEWTNWYPPIDLNNLFKYAVPKIGNYNLCLAREPMTTNFGTHYAQVWGRLSNASYGEAYGTDLALALFWAIWEVIRNDR